MRIQRSGLPLMILAGVLLIAAAGIVLLVADPFGQGKADAQPRPEAESQPESQPADDPPEPEPEDTTAPAIEIIPASTYTVREGDTLFDIAGEVWNDPFLWPILLQANDERLEDPDYLQPGHTVIVPEWVTVDSGLTREQRTRLSEAHVLAYTYYRSLDGHAIGLGIGQPAWWLARLGRIRMNKALWVLYSGLRYDEDLLDTFTDSIRDEDILQVRTFRTRFGLPPYRR